MQQTAECPPGNKTWWKFQQKGWSDSLRPMDRHGNIKVRGRRPSQLPLDRPQNSQEPLQHPGPVRKSHRRKGTLVCSSNGTGSTSVSSVTMVAIPDCVDNATQTDISFQNMYNDPNDYFDVSNHEVDRQDDLEYEVRTKYHRHKDIKT
eukprot:superscaffoldBa00006724_g21835